MAPAGGRGDVLIEIVVQGAFAKATAIDSATGLEASVVGPATAPREALSDAARRKLDYLLRKKS
jgi:hypothetical protein